MPPKQNVCEPVLTNNQKNTKKVHIQFYRQTATDKHALHKAAKCRERLFPCPWDGNFAIFTAGPVALAASCHVIRLSPRGLEQTPVVSRLGGGHEGAGEGGWISH